MPVKSNMKSGIYQIIHKDSGKRYIGSGVDIGKRKCYHLRSLKQNKHCNCHLQNAWNKYGQQKFIFEVIEYCQKDRLLDYQQHYINLFNFKMLYNINPIAYSNLGRKGQIPWIKGKKHSIETRKKISEAHKGKKLSEQTKRKISQVSKGKKPSEQTKKKMSEAKQNMSDQTKRKMSQVKKGKNNPFYGKKHTDQSKLKQSQANLGQKHPLYNSKWMHDGQICKRVKINQILIYLQNGFIFGRLN